MTSENTSIENPKPEQRLIGTVRLSDRFSWAYAEPWLEYAEVQYSYSSGEDIFKLADCYILRHFDNNAIDTLVNKITQAINAITGRVSTQHEKWSMRSTVCKALYPEYTARGLVLLASSDVAVLYSVYQDNSVYDVMFASKEKINTDSFVEMGMTITKRRFVVDLRAELKGLNKMIALDPERDASSFPGLSESSIELILSCKPTSITQLHDDIELDMDQILLFGDLILDMVRRSGDL